MKISHIFDNNSQICKPQATKYFDSENDHSFQNHCFEKQLLSHRVYHRGDFLIASNQRFTGLYILRTGTAKTYTLLKNGDEQITKFLHAGDWLGFDGMNSGFHDLNVQFLETSSVYFINKLQLTGMLKKDELFTRNFIKSMHNDLNQFQSVIVSLTQLSSEQKIAKFLLDISEKQIANGKSKHNLILSMSRTDIANYLGMALETVSRILTDFQRNNIISVNNRRVSILDYQRLIDKLSDKNCSLWSLRLDGNTKLKAYN